MNFKKYISLIIALATVGSFALAIPAFAQTATNHGFGGRGMGKGGAPGVFGTVSTINGATLTVSTNPRQNPNGATSTLSVLYTVDATNATVTKNGAASSVSAIAVGATVTIQ